MEKINQMIRDDALGSYKTVRVLVRLVKLLDEVTGLSVVESISDAAAPEPLGRLPGNQIYVDTQPVKHLNFECGRVYEFLCEIDQRKVGNDMFAFLKVNIVKSNMHGSDAQLGGTLHQQGLSVHMQKVYAQQTGKINELIEAILSRDRVTLATKGDKDKPTEKSKVAITENSKTKMAVSDVDMDMIQ